MSGSAVQYSFVVPIYEDGSLAEDFVNEFQTTLKKYLQMDDIGRKVELIFVDDGSTNDSIQLLLRLSSKHRFITVIELSRNFGQHVALTCGYHHACGDYVGVLDVDMQDPPYQLPLLLDKIKKGDADIVQGLRTARRSSLIDRITSFGFKKLFNWLTQLRFPANASTLRVMNRKVVDSLNQYPERCRFIMGLEYIVGFKREFVPVDHHARAKGKSSYNFYKRFLLALEGLISFSDLPLRLFLFLGSSFAILGVLIGVLLIIQKMFFLNLMPGYTSIMAVILFASGIIIVTNGVMGLYVGRILLESKDRPLYHVRNIYKARD